MDLVGVHSSTAGRRGDAMRSRRGEVSLRASRGVTVGWIWWAGEISVAGRRGGAMCGSGGAMEQRVGGSVTRMAEPCTKFTVDAYDRFLRSSKDSKSTVTAWSLGVENESHALMSCPIIPSMLVQPEMTCGLMHTPIYQCSCKSKKNKVRPTKHVAFLYI